MSLCCISDIHAADPSGGNYEILLNFLDHESAKRADVIVLLGDVFDHLTGEHKGYLEKYSLFFTKVEEHLRAGKKIYFIEGNHDFHFINTFYSRLAKSLTSEQLSRFSYVKGFLSLEWNGKKFVFCHGDQMDLSNTAYRRWKKIYSSRWFGFIISNLLSFSIVEKIGERASSDSKERGRAIFNFEDEKQRYRKAAQELIDELGCDVLVAGHTHIKDEFHWLGKSYWNIGFPKKDRSFLHFSKRGAVRVSI